MTNERCGRMFVASARGLPIGPGPGICTLDAGHEGSCGFVVALEQSTGSKVAQINAAPEVGAPTGAVESLDNALMGREHDVLMLRSLIARLPMTEKEPSAELQAWYDEYKDVMDRTNPTWWDGSPRAASILRASPAVGMGEEEGLEPESWRFNPPDRVEGSADD